MSFEDFNHIIASKKKESDKSSNGGSGFAYFEELTRTKISPQKTKKMPELFQLNFQFGKQFLGTEAPPKQNILLQKILGGLKLKQLKDLLRKNEQYVLDFADLKIQKEIGSGSAGEVYLGAYKELIVAIKKVKAKENPNALKQF